MPADISSNPRFQNRRNNHAYHTQQDNNYGYGSSSNPQRSAQFALNNGLNDYVSQSQVGLTTSQYTGMSKEKADDTITQSSQILSERTLNLKKEITKLDDEILQL